MTLSPGSAFQANTVTPAASETPVPSFPVDPIGNQALSGWTLSGKGNIVGTGGGDGEAVRFTMDGMDGQPRFPPSGGDVGVQAPDGNCLL